MLVGPRGGSTLIRVGAILFGYCGGYFGRDAYEDKRVEAVGADWVVARGDSGRVYFTNTRPEDLQEYLEPEPDDY